MEIGTKCQTDALLGRQRVKITEAAAAAVASLFRRHMDVGHDFLQNNSRR